MNVKFEAEQQFNAQKKMSKEELIEKLNAQMKVLREEPLKDRKEQNQRLGSLREQIKIANYTRRNEKDKLKRGVFFCLEVVPFFRKGPKK